MGVAWRPGGGAVIDVQNVITTVTTTTIIIKIIKQ